ncbi:MAG: NAD(P)H-dependent oxidoreductase [Patescibacteria group bacterium]|nr:NAD(P)H-dependent oxidoreductase [Patescibacteria group bacterium]MCL5261825.1 NAD(P)H-dependent oxidoreductase [Patescibacteria group bacterium]
MGKLLIPVILGTGREGRRSDRPARFVTEEANRFGFESPMIDIRDFDLRFTDNKNIDKRWQDLVLRSQGIIIVAPEYNHGYPGELKLLLDQLYEEYRHKPVGICGVSSGFDGGIVMAEMLRIALIELNMIPIKSAMYFGNVEKLFDAEGKIIDQRYRDWLKEFFEELSWFASALGTKKG